MAVDFTERSTIIRSMLYDPNPDFDAHFDGTLFSLLSWEQLDDFWLRLDTGAGWYLYAVGEARPTAAADSAQVASFIREIGVLLRKDHNEDYCGIVYADNLESPQLIKIYDPNHLGASCGSSGAKVLPGWVMSRVPPSNLSPAHTLPQNRKRWWQDLLNLRTTATNPAMPSDPIHTIS
jgi:hypothetical protein